MTMPRRPDQRPASWGKTLSIVFPYGRRGQAEMIIDNSRDKYRIPTRPNPFRTPYRWFLTVIVYLTIIASEGKVRMDIKK
jgi:hypothetical protein